MSWSSNSSTSSSNEDDDDNNGVCALACDFTLVILDVSGFTKISGWLQKHKGSEGPELMSMFLSQYFHRMLDLVAFFDGDVLKFAGDALLIKFCATPAGLRAACTCAATAVQQLNNYVLPGNVPHTLSLHAAVDVGHGEEMFVGGVRGRWEHCLSGGVFRHIGGLLDKAGAGTVLVSQKAEEILQRAEIEDPDPGFSVVPATASTTTESAGDASAFEVIVDCGKLRTPYPSDTHTTGSSNVRHNHTLSRRFDKLATALPVPLSNRDLQAAVKQYCLPNIDSIMSTDFAAEMRDVATMFCLLPPYFCGGKCADLYQQIVVAFQVQLSKFDGRLRQFLTDDKGTVLIACFGLPGTSAIARELRAVRAAVGFREATRLLSSIEGYEDIQIGLAAGLVYCGNIGDASRCEYCVVGDSVNMAARLMGLAKKQAAANKWRATAAAAQAGGGGHSKRHIRQPEAAATRAENAAGANARRKRRATAAAVTVTATAASSTATSTSARAFGGRKSRHTTSPCPQASTCT